MVQDRLEEYRVVVNDLQVRSHRVVPLKDRRRPVTMATPVKAVCDYQNFQVSFLKTIFFGPYYERTNLQGLYFIQIKSENRIC